MSQFDFSVGQRVNVGIGHRVYVIRAFKSHAGISYALCETVGANGRCERFPFEVDMLRSVRSVQVDRRQLQFTWDEGEQ